MGKPDFVLASRNKVKFVHGFFWHAHGCKRLRIHKSNYEYDLLKLQRNSLRAVKNIGFSVACWFMGKRNSGQFVQLNAIRRHSGWNE